MSIEEDILIIDQLFVEDHFINLISIAAALKEFKWIDYVLQEKLDHIVHKLSPSVYHLALARVYLAKKDFLACRTELVHIDYAIQIYSERARSYQLICCYELEESANVIESNCKSFENYLRRSKINHNKKINSYLNFISLVRQMIKINVDKQRLFQKVNASSIAHKPWLLEKINVL